VLIPCERGFSRRTWFAIIWSFKTFRCCCENGSANRAEHHGGIGEIRDVPERDKVPKKENACRLETRGQAFLLRGNSAL